MSMVTVSAKKNRIFQRAFDHDEARALHEGGLSYSTIAERMGVSVAAVRRVCDPRVRERMNRSAIAHARKVRRPCLGGCGRLVWMQNKTRSGFCAACVAAQRTAADERDGELRCTKCREWKPDDEFPKERGKATRRGRKCVCRACDNAARADHRRRNLDREHATDNARKRKKAQMSMFVVLRKDKAGHWEELDRVMAASRIHAVEQTARGEGVYAAVSEGHLKEMPVRQTVAFKVEQEASPTLRDVAS